MKLPGIGPAPRLCTTPLKRSCRRASRYSALLNPAWVRRPYCEKAKYYAGGQGHRGDDRGLPACGGDTIIRLPDAQEWHIQHATDIGVLGVIVPTRHPPVARRSAGPRRAPAIRGINGINCRQTTNDNMLVVIMIETPTGVANAFDIASVPGVDVAITGNNA